VEGAASVGGRPRVARPPPLCTATSLQARAAASVGWLAHARHLSNPRQTLESEHQRDKRMRAVVRVQLERFVCVLVARARPAHCGNRRTGRADKGRSSSSMRLSIASRGKNGRTLLSVDEGGSRSDL
jgi:hypothetical protein